MPAILAYEQGLVNIDLPLDINSGLSLLHFASFYGNIKALRYIFGRLSISNLDQMRHVLLMKDTIAIDDNCENTPLHSAILSGELHTVYMFLNIEQFINTDT